MTYTFTPDDVTRTRDGRPWLKDAEFCDGIKGALKQTFDGKIYLSTVVTGKSEVRKLRAALRHFAGEQNWGLSLRAEDVSEGKTKITFRAIPKGNPPVRTKPVKVRRRKLETEDEYMARVYEAYPKTKGERAEAYAARLATVTFPVK